MHCCGSHGCGVRWVLKLSTTCIDARAKWVALRVMSVGKTQEIIIGIAAFFSTSSLRLPPHPKRPTALGPARHSARRFGSPHSPIRLSFIHIA